MIVKEEEIKQPAGRQPRRFAKRAAVLALAAAMTMSLAAGQAVVFADTEEPAAADGSMEILMTADSAEDAKSVDSAEDAAETAPAPVAQIAKETAKKTAEEIQKQEEEAAEEAAKQAVKNPLTGVGGYNKKAVGKRPVAIVVENDPKARPQWGIDDKEYAPDIILEGEMEGGETRTLWIWADMTALPSQIGPTRSARPPYIRFAEKFDAIFIHCGLSHSSYDYVGADAVFEQDGVDHINMLTYGEGSLFGRDYSRTSMLEHTAYVRGKNVPDAIAGQGFRTDINADRATTFNFVTEEEEEEPEIGDGLAAAYRYAVDLAAFPPEPEEPVGEACTTIDLQFSSITPVKHFEYSEKDQMYHTQDYYTDVARTNVLVLFDTTQYVTRANTWGSDPETYTDYLFEGGSGKLASLGRVQDITWKVQDGKIVILDKDGEPAELAPGRIWIGWGSTNHGGYVTTGK